MNSDGGILHWSARVLTADDLRRRLNGHRAVALPPGTVVTPTAQEQLRASGVRVDRMEPAAGSTAVNWGYAQERPYPLVLPAVMALARDGLGLSEIGCGAIDPGSSWSRAIAVYVAKGDCGGAVVFCEDPGVVCCVANKVPGLRAVGVLTVARAALALASLGANLLAVEMPGRTYFEIRQILRAVCARTNACPEGVAQTLRELDGHAHR